MTITTLTSREYNQNSSQAKKAALKGPVFITDRGRPAHVLLSIEEYRKLKGKTTNKRAGAGKGMSLIEALAMPEGTPDFEFDPPRFGDFPRSADLS